RDGNFEIYRLDLESRALARLTNDPNQDENPAWSPDGTKIAFAGTRDGRRYPDIFIMNSDGTGITRLTVNTGWDGAPAWVPDGANSAFTAMSEPLPPPLLPPLPPPPAP